MSVFLRKQKIMSKKQIVVILLLVGMFPASFAQTKAPKLTGKYRKIQKYIELATKEKLAGVIVYIQSPKRGEWIGVAGYSNLENKTLMQKDNIMAIASIGKMYNAVAVMKLVDEGRIKLDDPIANHLPAEMIDGIINAREVTIRHLLGHTSGIANYELDPELNRLYLSGQLKLDTLTHENALRRYVYSKSSLNKPGTEFHYSSTNYMLLALIVDKVVSEGHTRYLRKLIEQRGLSATYYRQTPDLKNVSYYGDLNQDGVTENLTAQTFETTNWFVGDDGIYASVKDAAHFIQDLMQGKIVSSSSLQEMKTGNKITIDTGLGLTTDQSFPYGLLYGHSGRGIGTTADLYYFPRQDITVAIFCNNGLRGSPASYRKVYNKMRTKIVKKLFLF